MPDILSKNFGPSTGTVGFDARSDTVPVTRTVGSQNGTVGFGPSTGTVGFGPGTGTVGYGPSTGMVWFVSNKVQVQKALLLASIQFFCSVVFAPSSIISINFSQLKKGALSLSYFKLILSWLLD